MSGSGGVGRFVRGLVGRGALRVARPVAMALALALAVTVGELAVVSGEAASAASAAPVAPAAVPAAAPVKAVGVVSRPDPVSAAVTARAQGSRVEVVGLRSETSTTWVNPDGTQTTEQHGGPIRFRDHRGALKAVDLGLADLPGGTVAPRGHPLGLSLAGSGKGAGGGPRQGSGTDLTFARERPGAGGTAREVRLVWPGLLGRPRLAGATATYVDAQPGVDLVVASRRTGFEQQLVVRTAEALAGLLARRPGGTGPSSNLEYKQSGHHRYRHLHIVHRQQRRWAPWW